MWSNLLITGFDGRNVAVSANAVELKVLMLALQNGNEIASKLMIVDGFHFTEEDVKTIIDAAWLMTRNLCSDITNLPETTEPPMIH